MSKPPRGSIWQKWDLHLHPPGTKKNDQYGDEDNVWNEYCRRIEESDVQAFGITDYFSADGYLNFIGQFRAKYPQSTKVFFPNIELCTNDVVNAQNEEVNLHLIFNSSDPGCEGKMRAFLQELKTHKTASGNRNIKASELSATRDFEEATTSRQWIIEALDNTFGSNSDLTEYVLILTSANNDGIRTAQETVDGKSRGKKRKVAITDELDKFSHAFLGNSGNVPYFLKTNRLDTKEPIEPKAVVTGSDAHSFQQFDDLVGKLALQDGVVVKEPTWIKADLSFEGLRQIIFEPEARVYIGEEPEIETLVRNDPRRYIESLRIGSIEGYDGRSGLWFSDEVIQLNKELVAIIGNKGSGKSALVDILGLVGNSHNQKYHHSASARPEELFSFLNREKFLKGRIAENFVGSIYWYAGEPDSKVLNEETNQNIRENVEYLPQKYLEKICTDIEDDEFRQKLNQVIFGYVDDKDRYGQDSLEDLVNYLANSTKEDIARSRVALHIENEKVVALETKLTATHKEDLRERLRIRNEEISAHEALRPTTVLSPPQNTDAERKTTKDISEIDAALLQHTAQVSDLETEQSRLTRRFQDIEQFKRAVLRQVEGISDLKPNYNELLTTLGINFVDVVQVSTDFRLIDEKSRLIKDRLDEIGALLRAQEDVDDLEQELQEDAKQRSLRIRIDDLQAKRSELIDQLDKPNREYQGYLNALGEWQERKKLLVGEAEEPERETLNWLAKELNAIDNEYPQQLTIARDARNDVSKSIFDKKKALLSHYDAIKGAIDREIDRYSDELGDYDIAIDASLRFETGFYDEFFKFINQGVKGSFYGVEEGRNTLKDRLEDGNGWEDPTQVFLKLSRVIDLLDKDCREGTQGSNERKDIFSQMKQDKNPVEFYDFLFGFEFLEAKYDLKVDQKDLSELSPGERGGVLLIFYLMLDRRDIPLVIDQPEDNLDNKSVYEILVTFLKKAKKRRQIIMATHNPNLAVVADAEQIINVSINKKARNDFDFYSGSIENPRINKKVVDILEGTLPAFNNRRLKYRRI